jgi:hypothetical protein
MCMRSVNDQLAVEAADWERLAQQLGPVAWERFLDLRDLVVIDAVPCERHDAGISAPCGDLFGSPFACFDRRIAAARA